MPSLWLAQWLARERAFLLQEGCVVSLGECFCDRSVAFGFEGRE